MTRPGTKPKPTALKALEGNPGQRPLNENEPEFPSGNLARPDFITFDPIARAEWDRVTPGLMATGLLNEQNLMVLAGYCAAFARWRRAEDRVLEVGMTVQTPSGYVQQVPQVSIAKNALDQMKALAVEFGMTPSAQSRITVTRTAKAGDLKKLLG